MTNRPLFGVSEFTTWPWSFERDVEEYARLGVEAIEVCEFKLDDARAAEQLARVAQAGLAISSVQPKLHSLFPDQPRPEPREPRARLEYFRRSIERFGRAAPGTTLVSITGAAPNGDYRRAFEVAVEEYRALAEYSAQHNVRVALEPLNPILMNVDTFVCTLADAMEIVRAVDHPSFGVFVDVWHIWPDGAAVEHIRECGEKIFGVHVNDWHRPRCFGDRASIGQGQIELAKLLRAIHQSGYRGAYTLEIFSEEWLDDSLWKSDLSQLIAQNKAAFEVLWQEAGCN
jgi:sugar phosphate isomerase/epimerase